MRAVAALLLCVSLGCSSKAMTPPAPPEVGLNSRSLAKGETASILLALSQSHQKQAALFGPHQLTISVQSKLSKDKEVAVNLQEEIMLSVDKDGVVHIQSSNNQNEGFDAYSTKTTDALATRFGPLQPTSSDAVLRARDTALAVVYANLEPLSPWLVFTPAGDQELAGKKGLLFTLDKEAAPAPSASPDHEKVWRATIEPELIAGELALDPQSGFLLFADFSLRYTALRSEQKILFEINVKAKLTSTGDAVAAIIVPEIIPLDPRLRVQSERLEIIGKAALQQQKERKKKAPKALPGSPNNPLSPTSGIGAPTSNKGVQTPTSPGEGNPKPTAPSSLP
jgi:hypothetical protein